MWGVIEIICLISLVVFSYLWVDPAVTLMLAETKPELKVLIEICNWGNTHRQLAFWWWIAVIILMLGFQLWVLNQKKREWKKTGLVVLLTAIGYPFLSRDIFGYLFGAKMVWQYRVNPYTVMPQVFMDKDLWLKFTYWVDRTYIYGGVFLAYSLIPMVLFGGNRFLLNLFGLKLMNAVLFGLIGVGLLRQEEDKARVWSYWWFNPLLIIELLINGHNDVLMLGLFLLAAGWLKKKKFWGSVGIMIASVLVKYASVIMAPLWFLKEEKREWLAKTMILVILVFLAIRGGHSWYYTWIFLAVPLANLKKSSLAITEIFLAGVLILKYGGFIWFNRWTNIPYLPDYSWFYWLGPVALGWNEWRRSPVTIKTSDRS